MISRNSLSSIIIPCWNNFRYTRACVESVLSRTEGVFELILVDNGSTDQTARWMRSLASDARIKTILNPRNLGFAKAVNQGMRAAQGDSLIWLNNDTVVPPGWLAKLRAAIRSDPSLGAVGPVTNACEGPQRIKLPKSFRLSHLPFFAEAFSLKNKGWVERVNRLIGFCLLLRREAVERVGLLDERFGLGCYEDFDYCLRLRQAGYELAVAADAFVYHHGHKSFPDEEARLSHSLANRKIFIDKWCRKAMIFLDELDNLQSRTFELLPDEPLPKARPPHEVIR